MGLGAAQNPERGARLQLADVGWGQWLGVGRALRAAVRRAPEPRARAACPTAGDLGDRAPPAEVHPQFVVTRLG